MVLCSYNSSPFEDILIAKLPTFQADSTLKCTTEAGVPNHSDVRQQFAAIYNLYKYRSNMQAQKAACCFIPIVLGRFFRFVLFFFAQLEVVVTWHLKDLQKPEVYSWIQSSPKKPTLFNKSCSVGLESNPTKRKDLAG